MLVFKFILPEYGISNPRNFKPMQLKSRLYELYPELGVLLRSHYNCNFFVVILAYASSFHDQTGSEVRMLGKLCSRIISSVLCFR
jgi:hypothetical protein